MRSKSLFNLKSIEDDEEIILSKIRISLELALIVK